jgi:hypothetical protein
VGESGSRFTFNGANPKSPPSSLNPVALFTNLGAAANLCAASNALFTPSNMFVLMPFVPASRIKTATVNVSTLMQDVNKEMEFKDTNVRIWQLPAAATSPRPSWPVQQSGFPVYVCCIVVYIQVYPDLKLNLFVCS